MSAPGWYPDPAGSGQQRYFDGKDWTGQYAPHAQPPQRKSRVGLWVLLSVVGVMILGFGGCVAFFGAVASNMDEGSSASQDPAGGLNQRVRDGKFEFSVGDVSARARPELPPARGQWVVAEVTVVNIGNEPQSFFVGNQKLIDTQGREYAADNMAAMRINTDDTMVLDLGPGFAISVLIPFDVPPGAQPATLELHDSAFSGGVLVDVS
ncbi:DUF4352 domain-containing protein [Mycolicibacterium hippocampi]|uniref:DUF4352 domain-containing protein n=1 Tax=Mycolicibacterium hippocampi TaxID=659824 RepID=UPI0035119F4D